MESAFEIGIILSDGRKKGRYIIRHTLWKFWLNVLGLIPAMASYYLWFLILDDSTFVIYSILNTKWIFSNEISKWTSGSWFRRGDLNCYCLLHTPRGTIGYDTNHFRVWFFDWWKYKPFKQKKSESGIKVAFILMLHWFIKTAFVRIYIH